MYVQTVDGGCKDVKLLTHQNTVGRMDAAVFECYELQVAVNVPLNGNVVFGAVEDR